MNKTQLIEAVAKKTELKKKDSEAVVNAVIESISEALASGEKVQLIGFGSFEVKTRAARTGRNPQTNKPIKIPAGKKLSFTAGAEIKKKINK